MQHELLIGYNDRHTFLNRLSGSTKLLCFVGLSVIGMMTYDTRYLIGVMIWECQESCVNETPSYI